MGFQKPTEPITHLDVDGKGFDLAFDFEAVAMAEDMTGRPLLTGLSARDIDRPTINLIRAMLYACLLKHQPKMLYAEAKALVRQDNLSAIWAAVVDAWNDGFPDKPEESQPDDPRPDQN